MRKQQDDNPTSSSGEDYAGPTLVTAAMPPQVATSYKATTRSQGTPPPATPALDSQPVEHTAVMQAGGGAATGSFHVPVTPRTASTPLVEPPSSTPQRIAYSSPPESNGAPMPVALDAVRVSRPLLRMYERELDETGNEEDAPPAGRVRAGTLRSTETRERPPAMLLVSPRRAMLWVLAAGMLGGAVASFVLVIGYFLLR